MDWQSYNDPVYAVSRPVQMGSVWKEAGYLSGMPLNDKLWIENPPSSSFPACMAVKTAELQGEEATEHFLRAVREAAMVNAKDISSKEVLLTLAKTVAEDFPGTLDYDRFAKELSSGVALDDLKSDFQKVKVRGISRYPSLLIRAGGGRAILITGYKPYQVIESALKRLLPDIEAHHSIDINDYKRQWRHLTDREVAEVQGGVA